MLKLYHFVATYLSMCLLMTFSGNTFADPTTTSEINCLALNIYHEARSEPVEGMFAVAFVTRNRVLDKRYPNTYCGVVWEKRWSKKKNRYVPQFTWTLDGKPDKPKESNAWKLSQMIAKAVYLYNLKSNVSGSLNYHATYVSPVWAKRMDVLALYGNHVFYKSH